MMYCKNCKFYKYDRTDEIIDEETYEVIKKIKRGECHNSNIRYSYRLENTDQLIYHDMDDYAAYLYVGEMFGCVHFKEKQDIQKLYATIEEDFRCLTSAVKIWKQISEDKWVNKSKFNSHRFAFIKMECDQFVHDCKKLLEEIEIREY